MTGPTPDPTTPVNRTATGSNPNNPPNLQDQILNHISSLNALVQLHNELPTGLVRPIRLSFDNEGGPEEKNDEEPENLRKLYKEVLKSPFSRRIIEFSAPNHRTPTNLKIYDGSTDPDDHITCFVGAANQGEWEMPVWRKCCKDPTEVSKIVRKANETLPDFKERWTEETGYIPDVPIVMQISSFMSNSKCPELARRFSDQVPRTVTEMMKRVNDFVKSEEAFKNMKMTKEEHPKKGTTTQFRGSRPPLHPYGNGPPRSDAYNLRDHYQPYVPPRAPDRRYDNKRHDHRRQEVNHLRLDSLTKLPSEILTTELQLQLLPCPSTVAPPRKENLDRYCEYHGKKEHYTNDCFHLKKQLEVALESGKLNHLIKDVRQKGNNIGRQMGNNNGKGKVINMVRESGKELKHGPLIIEAEVEGYLVRRVFVDQGAAMQVMFKHYFDNLSPDIKARLTPTQTELVGFFGEQLVLIRKIELEVQFGGGGLTRNVMMKFTIVRASSPYNITLGRTCLRELRVVLSTVHAMMKFPTPKGIATLCAQAEPVYECRWSERKVAKQEETKEKEERKGPNTEGEEKISVNPAFPEQTVTIDTQFSAKCHEQLIHLLNNNMDVFAWQPSDMVGVPMRLIKHALNVNNFVSPVAQKGRVLGTEKSRVVTREVWVKAGIIIPVKYPTWISNPILVKKVDDTWRMCIDFKNLNAACPKDYHPLSKIDLKIKVVVGYPLKSFLDAYKGYHLTKFAK
ncbi:reverse transcriptase domain-containing protein [Tanacetum coccineum]